MLKDIEALSDYPSNATEDGINCQLPPNKWEDFQSTKRLV
jgi:hypothetical protein